MALMVPDSIPSTASQGEKTLYGVLRDVLPDDFYVWYEPRVDSLHPDFVILGPTFGLLILEVKGWYANRIVRADSNFFDIKYKTDSTERIETQQSPLRQCHKYFGAVLDKFKQYPILTQLDGEYKGKLVFPTGFGAVMSNMSAAQAHKENIYPLLEQPQVAYRDELLAWSEFSERELISRLKEMFTTRFSFMALTDDQISTIKGILHPEMTIKCVLATEDSVSAGAVLPPDSIVLKTLDAKQEQMAREIGSGHRLFSGVAGSGKTLILLSRAKHLTDRQPESRILVLCFNKTLAAYLRSLLHEDEQNPQYRKRIEVMHFNAWAKSVLGRLPNPENVMGNYDEVLGEQLLKAIATLHPDKKWDAILVDEAHTFSPSWFKCCVAALKDSEQSNLMIVSDVSQKLYKRLKFTWKSVGIIVPSKRSKKLEQNYRNTQEILSAAWNVVKPISISDKDEVDITFPLVEPKNALRHGSRPSLYLASSRTAEVKAAVQQVRKLHEFGYQPEEIAILYHHKGYNDQPLFNDLVRQLDDSGLGAYWVTATEQGKSQYSTKHPGVRIITALSSLGLEFKAVVILWVQQFDNQRDSDSELATLSLRQLYVAMTRAQNELHLFGSGNVPILNKLRQSQYFEVCG